MCSTHASGGPERRTAPLRATRVPGDRQGCGPAAGTPMRRLPAPSPAWPSARAEGRGPVLVRRAGAQPRAQAPAAASPAAVRVPLESAAAGCSTDRARSSFGTGSAAACGVAGAADSCAGRVGAGAAGAGADPGARTAAASGALAAGGAGFSASRGATIMGETPLPASSRGRRSSSCTITVSVAAMTKVAATDSGTRHRDAQDRRRASAACCSSDCGRVPTARRAAARMRSSSSGGGSSRGVSRYARSRCGSRRSGSVTSAPVRAGMRAVSSARTAAGSSRSRD